MRLIGCGFEAQPIAASGLEGQKQPGASCQPFHHLGPFQSAVKLIYSAPQFYISKDYFSIKQSLKVIILSSFTPATL